MAIQVYIVDLDHPNIERSLTPELLRILNPLLMNAERILSAEKIWVGTRGDRVINCALEYPDGITRLYPASLFLDDQRFKQEFREQYC